MSASAGLRRQLYKATNFPHNNKEAKAQRVERDARRRSEHREQLILGKRFHRRRSLASDGILPG